MTKARITQDGKLKITGELIEKTGEIYTFDGSNSFNLSDYISVSENMFNNENFVFEADVKHDGSSGERTIYADSANDSFSFNRIHVSNNKVVVRFENQGAVELDLVSNASIPSDEWTRIRVVRNGFDFTIFINGVEDVTGTWNKGSWSYAPAGGNVANSRLGGTYYGWTLKAPLIGEMKNVNLIPSDLTLQFMSNGDLQTNELINNGGISFYSDGKISTVEFVEGVESFTEAGTFSPSSISGLEAWYDASEISLTEGANINQWDDLSGNGKHAIQDDSNAQPKIQNGIVEFDTEDRWMLVPDSTTYGSIFAVANYNRTSFGGYSTIIAHESQYIPIFMGYSGKTELYSSNINPDTIMIDGVETFEASPLLENHVYYAENGSFPSENNRTIGCERSGSDRYWNGGISEIIIYNRVLSDTERVEIENYLNEKWGV